MLPPTKILKLNFFYYSNFPIKSNFNFGLQKHLLGGKITPVGRDKKVCKNFFLLILFLKYINLKLLSEGNIFFKYKFFIKPNQQNIFNYLRAPYKNKLSRNQVYMPRYKFSIELNLLTNTLPIKQPHQSYFIILKFFKMALVGISSNIFYLNKIKINYKGLCTNF